MTDLFQIAATQLNDLRNAVPQHERITNDEHGILRAMTEATRADCTRRRVGAVIVDVNNRVVGTGRNGAPPGAPGCLSAGACPRGRFSYDDVPLGSSYSNGQGLCISLHAEKNARFYVLNWQACIGGTMYVSDIPCLDCDRDLGGSGLARVVWPELVGSEWVLKDHIIGTPGGIYA